MLEVRLLEGRWTYQLAAVAGSMMTDNVIDLMTRKIKRLSPEGQTALTLAACVGSPFDLDTLAVVSRRSREAAGAQLNEALAEGLVLPEERSQDSAAQSYCIPARPGATGGVRFDPRGAAAAGSSNDWQTAAGEGRRGGAGGRSCSISFTILTLEAV